MKPRILYLDIETSPSLGYYFDLWKEGNIVRTVKSWFILSYAYKWEHERTYRVRALCDYRGYAKHKNDDKALVTDLWKLLDQADIVIAHNGDRFDLRKIRSRFLKHRLKPPSPFKTIDTLKVMRRYFAEDSNRLDAVARAHGLGAKLPHQGFKLWEDCINGVRKAWVTLKRYNIQDVRLLVATYKLVRPYMATHPDLRVYDGRTGCPSCPSTKVQKRGFTYTKTMKRQAYVCVGCGARYTGEKV